MPGDRATSTRRSRRANLEPPGSATASRSCVGPAGASLDAMPDEPTFDFAFIDADKTGYPTYYELVLPRVRPGGLILLDNMLQGGRVLSRDTESARVIDELNRRIHDDERVDMAMTISADGLMWSGCADAPAASDRRGPRNDLNATRVARAERGCCV